MALPSSGEISLHDIAAEFGGSAPYALRDYLGAAPGIPSSGDLSLHDFYGASASPASPAGYEDIEGNIEFDAEL